MATVPTTAPVKKSSTPILVFPSELRSVGGYPYMAFVRDARVVVHANEDKSLQDSISIHLPMPTGLKFDEDASYDGVDTGLAGAAYDALANAGSKIGAADGFTGKAMAALGQGKELVNNFVTLEAAKIAAQKISNDAIAAKIKQGKGIISQSNTVTTFHGNKVRTFSFSYKLIAKSEEEARDIRAIVKTFREAVYGAAASGDNMGLSIPPKWHLKFYSSPGVENPFIPQIDECYITGASVSFNEGTNLFHFDGSPIETDVTVSFSETRVLRYDDIRTLQPELAQVQKGVKRRPSLIKSIKDAFKKNK
jgi:hypothetical protein